MKLTQLEKAIQLYNFWLTLWPSDLEGAAEAAQPFLLDDNQRKEFQLYLSKV